MTEPVDTPRMSAIARDDLIAPAVLYVVAVVLYALLGHQQALPLVSPDEFTYGHLARSLADGQGFDWRGESVALHSALYVFLITPAWLVDNTVTAYGLTKLLGAVMLSTVLWPVWLLGRQLLTPRLALLVAALAVAGTWMATSALVLTENLAFPLTTGALAGAVMTLRRPGSRWGWVTLALCLLAAWARFQLVLLVPVVAIAIGIDVLRAGGSQARAARLRAHRPQLVSFGVVLAIAALLALADTELIAGVYSGTTHFSPPLGRVVAAIGKSWLSLLAMAGFIPIVVSVSLATTRRAWRDDDAGPLLAVLVPTIVLFVIVSGWTTAGFRVPWPIQRYVEYALPLAFLLLGVVAQRPGLLPRSAWLVAAALGLLAFLGPTAEPLEGRAYDAVATGMRQLLGTGAGTGVGLVALLVGLGGVALLLGLPRVSWRPAAWMVVALGLLVVGLQAQSSWRWQLNRADEWRSGFPADLRAVDHAAGGPVARVFLTRSHPRFETVDFFNRRITQVFVPPGSVEYGRTLRGGRCPWSIDAVGTATYTAGCGPAPARIYLDDPAAIITYAGQHDVRRIHGLGRLVSVAGPPAPTKIRAIAVTPCDDRTLVLRTGRVLGFAGRTCRAAFSTLLWLDAPGTLAVGIRGGAADHIAQVGKRVFRLPAGKLTTIRVQVPKGPSRLDMRFDTQELPAGLPDVSSAVLSSGGVHQSLL